MSDPFQEIAEPSLPEHNLLREAGSLPELTPGLRERVLLNCYQQLRYGRWADRMRVTASVVAACLLVLLVWSFRWPGASVPTTTTPPHDTATDDGPASADSYSSLGMDAEDPGSTVDADPGGKSLPQGGPSTRRQLTPEMRQLDQMIEKLQNRHNVLCGLLPYL